MSLKVLFDRRFFLLLNCQNFKSKAAQFSGCESKQRLKHGKSLLWESLYTQENRTFFLLTVNLAFVGIKFLSRKVFQSFLSCLLSIVFS